VFILQYSFFCLSQFAVYFIIIITWAPALSFLADFGNYLPSDSIVYGLGQQVIYLVVHSETAQFALVLPVDLGLSKHF